MSIAAGLSFLGPIAGAIGGLFRGGAAKTVARLSGKPVAPSAKSIAAAQASAAPRSVPGVGLVPASRVAGLSGFGGAVVGAGATALGGAALSSLMAGGGKRKRRRGKGITGAELRGFRKVYKFLDDHCAPKLKLKAKAKRCR